MKKKIDLVMSGSGTLLVCHIGAYARLRQSFNIERVAGTSGGGIVAAGIAFDWEPSRMMDLTRKFLNPKILERNWLPWNGWSLHRNKRPRKLIRESLPYRMGDAKIPFGVFVLDIETQKTVFLNSWDHPNVPLEYALMSTACIPFFFKAMRIPGIEGLFVDGGATSNFAMDVWDDSSRPTVGVKFEGRPRRRPVYNTVDFTRQLVGSLIDNANNTHNSSKDDTRVIQIASRGDSMAFNIDEKELKLRFSEGYHATDQYLKKASSADRPGDPDQQPT